MQAVTFGGLIVLYLRRGQRRRSLDVNPPNKLAPALISCASDHVCSLNSSLNLLNKWSLGVYGFRFPFLLTSCEQELSFAPRVLWRALALQPLAALTLACRPHGLQLRGAGPCGDAGVVGRAPRGAGEAVEGRGLHRCLYGLEHRAEQHIPARHLAHAQSNHSVRAVAACQRYRSSR